mmetsp:Transcript_66789/g.193383  ORF Transcript_66789/g.193383 Transcript_66789/m.193383 type:complete len:261 (-) Transcript_66789:1596-2378(-)
MSAKAAQATTINVAKSEETSHDNRDPKAAFVHSSPGRSCAGGLMPPVGSSSSFGSFGSFGSFSFSFFVVVVAVVVVAVVVGRTDSMIVVLRRMPVCEMASSLIWRREMVTSKKPYWSSLPSVMGEPSEVMPPPPPDTTTAVPPKGPAPLGSYEMLCAWMCPARITSMPCFREKPCQKAGAETGGKCVTMICHSAWDTQRCRSSQSTCCSQRRLNQSLQSSTLAGPVAEQCASGGLWVRLQMLWLWSASGARASTTFVSTK